MRDVRRSMGWYWRQVQPGTVVGFRAFRMLTSVATVHVMQLEQTLAFPQVVTRRRRLRLAAHAVAAFVAAVVVALLVAAEAAAADDLGSLVDEAVAVAEPILEPVTPVVEPFVEQATEPLAPIVDPIIPIVPVTPIAPIAPILDTVPPLLEQLAPLLNPPVEAVTPPGVDVRVERRAATLPTPADARGTTAAAPHAATSVAAAVPASLDGGGLATLMLEVGDLFESIVPMSGPPADAGTTLVAALLIGLFLALSPGWATSALAGRLRPIGLTLAPPVPPG